MGAGRITYLENDAVFSDCGKYRYLLRRVWDFKRPRVLFVMLNPSTADALQDDATIRSCVRLAKGWGHGSIEVVNLFAYRATDPEDLQKQADPLGPQNYDVVGAAISRSDFVVCAWGAHAFAESNGRELRRAVIRKRPAAFCLGKTKSGAPKHPLYIKTGTPLEAYP